MQGFHPQKHKTQPKNYANGGIVKGPGSGTSDSVPAMVPRDGFVLPADTVQATGFKPGMRAAQLSAGEAVLNPQQVQAAGGFQALEAMKNATHTPVPEQGAEGQKFFFVNGGPLDDEKRKPFMPTLQPEVQRDMTKMYSAGMPPRPQPAPLVGDQAAGGGRGFINPQAVKPSPTPSGPGFMPGTRAVFNESGKAIGDLAGQGRYGAALGEAARAATAYGPAVADDLVGGAVRAVVPGAMDAAKQFLGFGGEAQAATPPVVSPVAKAPPVAPAATAVTPSGAPEQPGTPAAQANMQTSGNVNVRRQPNGVMEFSGDNVSGDVSYSGPAGFKPRSSVSEQNMAAADSLAQRSAARGFTPQVQSPAPVASQNLTPPDTGQGYGFGLANSNRIQQRNLSMDVQQGKPGSKLALQGFLQQQADAPGQQIERDRLAQSATESAADRGFKSQELAARMGDSAANRDLKAQELADNSATNSVKRDAAGVELKSAKQIAELRAAYLNARTPEEQSAIVTKLNALSGNVKGDEYMAVSSGQSVDPVTGMVTKSPDIIVNKRTGQPVQGQQVQAQGTAKITPDAAGKAAFDAMPKGARYVGPDGKTYIKN